MPTGTSDSVHISHAAAETESGVDTLNVSFDDVTISMGDSGTLSGPEARHGLAFVFDLSSDGGFPKTATLTGVKISLTPTTTLSLSGGDADHRFALMAQNGGWDRATSHALHADNSGIVYGNPSRRDTIRVRGHDVIGGSVVFLTESAGAGHHTITTSSVCPTLGTTFRLPAGKTLQAVSFFMNRVDGTSSDSIKPILYELAGNGRHFAIERSLDYDISTGVSFSARAYSELPTVSTWTEWGALVPLAATGSDRWFGLVLEGDWFTSGVSATTRRVSVLANSGNSDTIFRVATDGSFFTAGLKSSLVKDNSLSDIAFPYASDIPHIYGNNTTTLLTTPFQRHVGNVLASTNQFISINWVDGTTYNYGTAAPGQMNVITGCLAEFQAWIDSDAYDPVTGKHFLGMMIEVLYPDDELWDAAGDGHSSYAKCTLTLTFENTSVSASASRASAVDAASALSSSISTSATLQSRIDATMRLN